MQRKEKLLKKQHRQALLLDGMLVDALGPGRSLRGRKPVSYTFGMISYLIWFLYIFRVISKFITHYLSSAIHIYYFHTNNNCHF